MSYEVEAIAGLNALIGIQERIAAADERRNELLVADAAKRDTALERSFLADQERWASFGAGEPAIDALRALRDTILEQELGHNGVLAAIGEMLTKLEGEENPGATTDD